MSKTGTIEQIADFFSNIRDRSVTTMENFLCCTDCGFDSIHSHRTQSDIGFCFYHSGDVKTARETSTLYLSWGAYSNDELDFLTVAEAIKDEAQACKLDVEWNGSITDRIVLKNLDPNYFSLPAKEEA